MAKAVSCTATVGGGSERHNHDLEYRDSLPHTKTAETPDAVIELIPYRSYKDQINDLVKPYIDEYNYRRDEAYNEALARFNSGERKSKPRRANYKHIDYDYFTEHLHDTYYNQHTEKHEELLMWRSLILGFGDKNDRDKGNITKEQALAVMQGVVARWEQEFPALKLLGVTFHVDEDGFFHAHFDYKPFYEHNSGQGLNFEVGQESALEHMGFQPEQALINERDKAPIRFNAFRNRIYALAEEELAKQGLRLEYGVSKRKAPGEDSSVNKPLEKWQSEKDKIWDETREVANEAQRIKNKALDVIDGDMMSDEGLKKAINFALDAEDLLRRVEASPKTVSRDGHKITFNIFSQLKSFVKGFVDIFAHLLNELRYRNNFIDKLLYDNEDLKKTLERREAEVDRWKVSHNKLQKRNAELSVHEADNKLRKAFMTERSLETEFQRTKDALRHQTKE